MRMIGSGMLSTEQMLDMPLGGMSKEKQLPHWCGNIIYWIVHVLLKILYRYKVEGLQTLRSFKGKGGVVVVANHKSFFDVAFMWCSARLSQWIRFMARDTFYGKAGGLLGQIFARCGAFPVTRDSADRTSVKRAAKHLKNGEIVGIYPEGTRRGKGNVDLSLHAGVALIARMGHAPMLPSTAVNVEKIKQKGKLPRFPKVIVRYGEPVYIEQFDFLPKTERLEGAAWYVMRECFALDYGCPADQVDMVALFPDTKDYADVFAEHPLVPMDAQSPME